jgi:hypothetical protein
MRTRFKPNRLSGLLASLKSVDVAINYKRQKFAEISRPRHAQGRFVLHFVIPLKKGMVSLVHSSVSSPHPIDGMSSKNILVKNYKTVNLLVRRYIFKTLEHYYFDTFHPLGVISTWDGDFWHGGIR